MTYRLRNILIALGLAILAALLVTFYVANYKKHVQKQEVTVPVVVAARDIPAGTSGADIIKGHFLTTEQVSRTAVVPGALSNPSEISKQVAQQPIYAGEQVTARRFGYIYVTGIHSQLTGVYRAIQLPGDANQLLAGTLRAGDHVDIVANVHFNISDFDRKALSQTTGTNSGGSGQGTDQARVASRIVLRDITVLRTSTGAGSSKLNVGGSAPGNWVVLQLTDNQLQKMYWLQENANWWLALRPVLKPNDSPNTVETVESVLGDGLSLGPYAQLFAGKAGPTR
jgi:Flp pilus assembly protein CpaB